MVSEVKGDPQVCKLSLCFIGVNLSESVAGVRIQAHMVIVGTSGNVSLHKEVCINTRKTA